MSAFLLGAVLATSAAAQVEFPVIVVEGEPPAPAVTKKQRAPTPPEPDKPLLRSGFRDRLLQSVWDL
jgi:hypothetical protein